MSQPVPFTFDAPSTGLLALIVLIGTIVLVRLRRPALPTASMVLAGGGLLLLALAAGGATWRMPQPRTVTVLVDLSPSTRTASYRDPAILRRRVEQLLGDRPHEVRFFADGWGTADLVASSLADLPARRTVLPEVEAPALLLFGDGRLATPDVMPPTYCIVDSGLDDVIDAAVTALEPQGDSIAVGVRNAGGARPLALRGMTGPSTVEIAAGAFSLVRKGSPQAGSLSASFAPGDPWPENDTLRSIPLPPGLSQRWWVGRSDPGAGWRHLPPQRVPNDVSQFLPASLVVIDNISADDFDASQHAALDRYVREMGGSLLLLGGDQAFAAGGYAGTPLEALSPLASTPPEPTTHWLLVADSSGSMNQSVVNAAGAAAGRTRWQYAADAVIGVSRQLPPADLLSVGSFAQRLRWWSHEQTVAQTQGLPLPPLDARPGGPTNLDAALREIAAGSDASLPKHLLLATDADAQIDDPEAVAATYKSKQMRLHVLLIGDDPAAKGLPALQAIVDGTGGSLRSERLPENWAAGLLELMRAARPRQIEQEPSQVRFTNALEAVGVVAVELWNRTWPKEGVSTLAEAQVGGQRITMVARWNVGSGQAAAVAFELSPARVAPLADLVGRPPRDPRFKISWDMRGPIRVGIDAFEGTRLLNGESLTLELRPAVPGASPVLRPIPQAGPGHYELTAGPQSGAVIASVRQGKRILDTTVLAERYAPEFDAIGNDRSALAAIARRTGGAVIEPGVTRQLDLPAPWRNVSLVSFLATAGAALTAAALVRWRWGT